MTPTKKTATEQAVDDLTARVDRLEPEVWTAIDKIRERLPVWATLFIWALGVALGVAVTVAVRR
jgi:hypothetical protein